MLKKSMGTMLSAATLFACLLFPNMLATASAEAEQTTVGRNRRSGKFALKGIGGYSLVYWEEPFFPAFGAATRVPLTRSVSLEPQVFYVTGSRFKTGSFVPYIVWHIGEPGQRTRFYLVGGVGYAWQHDNAIDYLAKGVALSGGVGVEFSVSDRISLAPDVRFGTDGFPRATFGVVYHLENGH